MRIEFTREDLQKILSVMGDRIEITVNLDPKRARNQSYGGRDDRRYNRPKNNYQLHRRPILDTEPIDEDITEETHQKNVFDEFD